MDTFKLISPNTAKQYLGRTGMAVIIADVQSFWDDVYTEAVEAGEDDVERHIVQRYKAERLRYGDPLLVVGEVYYYPVMDRDGGIDVMDENECDIRHIEV